MSKTILVSSSMDKNAVALLDEEAKDRQMSRSKLVHSIIRERYGMEDKPETRGRGPALYKKDRKQILDNMEINRYYSENQIREVSGLSRRKVRNVLELYASYFHIVITKRGYQIRRYSRNERKKHLWLYLNQPIFAREYGISNPHKMPTRALKLPSHRECLLMLVENFLIRTIRFERLTQVPFREGSVEEFNRWSGQEMTEEEYLPIIMEVRRAYEEAGLIEWPPVEYPVNNYHAIIPPRGVGE